MTDEAIGLLVDRLEGAPRLELAGRRYVYLEAAGPVPALVLVLERVGAGRRWAWAPNRGTHPAARPPIYFPRQVVAWLELAARFDLVAHGHAMAARTL